MSKALQFCGLAIIAMLCVHDAHRIEDVSKEFAALQSLSDAGGPEVPEFEREERPSALYARQPYVEGCGNGVMSFRLANLIRNNLGNQGPDSGEEGMLISNVFPDSGRDISLLLNAITDYTPHKNDKNGLWKNGEFHQINIRCGTETDVQFTFVDSETLEPVQVPKFYMTFYDLDEMKKGIGREYLKFSNIESASLSKSTIVAREEAGDKIIFRSTQYGGRGDNPTHPRQLTQEQKDKAVEVLFPSASQFVVTFGASNAGEQVKGRNVLFSGASSLDCPQVAMCNSAQCPSGYRPKPFNELITCNGASCQMDQDDDRDSLCNDDARMVFKVSTVSRNNLGNQGPNTEDDEGIMFDNVFPESGKRINLLLNAESQYTFVDKYNGLNSENSIAKINMLTDTSVDLSFNFVDESGDPVEVGPFYMVFFDFDENKDAGMARESLTVRGHSSYSLTFNSLVSAVQQDDGSVTFTSTVHGTGKDNPKNAMELSDEQMDKSVAVAFPRLSTFRATFSVGALHMGWKGFGRNINFAGFTNMVCNDNVVLKHNRVPMVSSSTKDDDRDKCCDYNGLCNDDARMVFRASTVSRNNLGNQGPNTEDLEGIMYDNVFPVSGKHINLLLNAKSQYTLVDKYNGLNKQKSIAVINMRTETSVDLSFNFVDESGYPVEVGPFYMVFLDFDEDENAGKARESLTVRGHSSYSLTDNSLVSAVEQDDGSVIFSSTVYGIGKDNAKNATKLSHDQMRKSVAIAFPRLSTFHATFRVGALPVGWKGYGRNINFAGFTNMVCNDNVVLKDFHAGAGRRNRVPMESSFTMKL